jgi:hypothetical protein
MGDKIADVYRGQQRALNTVTYGWCHNFYFLPADKPMRRVFGLNEAVHANNDPSDVVPGLNDDGRPSSSCLSCGGEEGPQGLDHVLDFFSRSFLLKVKNHVVFHVLCKVLFVICPTV